MPWVTEEQVRGLEANLATMERYVAVDIPEALARERRAGAWEALDRVLNHLNTLDEQRPDKGELYKAIMEMRP